MGASWALAFVGATVLTVVGTPFVRRLALATAFVDHPGDHKSHVRSTPYLGGVSMIIAVLAVVLLVPNPAPQVAVVALGAALLGVIGLLDDHRTLGPAYRFLAETAVALAVVATGLRVHATGILLIDAALTVFWIVGVTNAVNLLDNMDGLAAGVTAAAGTAVLVLALLGEQSATATIAAGLVGACLGFLVYNRPPASIFMGDTGSLFLGFILAVITLDVNPSLSPPASFIVPLILLALPVLDTATVTVARLRHGISPAQGGRDHLSHRLVARGLSRGSAVMALVATELALGAVAVAAGRQSLALGVTVLLTGVILGGVVIVTAPAKVYDRSIVGLPRVLKFGMTGMGIAVLLIATPAALAVGRAQSSTNGGAHQLALGLQALEAGDRIRAQSAFQAADASLTKADSELTAPLTSLGLGVPGVASNLRASRAIVEIGRRLESTDTLLAITDYRRIALAGAPLGPDEMQRLTDASLLLKRLSSYLNAAQRPYLVPEVSEAVHLLDDWFSLLALRIDETLVLRGAGATG